MEGTAWGRNARATLEQGLRLLRAEFKVKAKGGPFFSPTSGSAPARRSRPGAADRGVIQAGGGGLVRVEGIVPQRADEARAGGAVRAGRAHPHQKRVHDIGGEQRAPGFRGGAGGVTRAY